MTNKNVSNMLLGLRVLEPYIEDIVFFENAIEVFTTKELLDYSHSQMLDLNWAFGGWQSDRKSRYWYNTD